MLVPLILVGFLAVALAASAIVLALQNSRLKNQLEETRSAWAALRDTPRQLEAAVRDASDKNYQIDSVRRELDGARRELDEAQRRIADVSTEDRKKEDWLDHQEKELEWCKLELTRRPKIVRQTYKILTLGISGTGKTALTLKWANPLVDLGQLEGTKVERYERTVSQRQEGGEITEHVFEIRDWGGEHIVEAQQELIVDEIHGLLLVVDLAARDGKTVEPARVQQQLREFQPESLRFFFGGKTMATCQAVVLFINKSDVLAGTPADVEREARRYYQRLIDDLERYSAQLDVRVLIGSATYGHSTHHLFSHFVGKILPESAYDRQLLQRMKTDAASEVRTQPLASGQKARPALPAAPTNNLASPAVAPAPPVPAALPTHQAGLPVQIQQPPQGGHVPPPRPPGVGGPPVARPALVSTPVNHPTVEAAPNVPRR
jgi:hypothetical protein